MHIAVFSAKAYDRRFLTSVNRGRHPLRFLDAQLDATTAILADGGEAVCLFVNAGQEA